MGPGWGLDRINASPADMSDFFYRRGSTNSTLRSAISYGSWNHYRVGVLWTNQSSERHRRHKSVLR